jgi:hypothetical protein
MKEPWSFFNWLNWTIFCSYPFIVDVKNLCNDRPRPLLGSMDSRDVGVNNHGIPLGAHGEEITWGLESPPIIGKFKV